MSQQIHVLTFYADRTCESIATVEEFRRLKAAWDATRAQPDSLAKATAYDRLAVQFETAHPELDSAFLIAMEEHWDDLNVDRLDGFRVSGDLPFAMGFTHASAWKALRGAVFPVEGLEPLSPEQIDYVLSILDNAMTMLTPSPAPYARSDDEWIVAGRDDVLHEVRACLSKMS